MVIENMTFQGNLIQATIEGAINPSTILGKKINRGTILGQRNKGKSYCGNAINRGIIVGKAINHEFNLCVRSIYWSLPNNRLKLTAPSVHAFDDPAQLSSWAGGKKRAPRPAA